MGIENETKTNINRRWLGLVILVAPLLLATTFMQPFQEHPPGFGFASAGGAASSAGFRLSATFGQGQPVGSAGGRNFNIGGGYRQAVAALAALPPVPIPTPVVPHHAVTPGKVAGRGIFGPVVEKGNPSLVILTEQGHIKIVVDAQTEITSPGGALAGLQDIRVDPPTRVAVMADRSPLDDWGLPTSEPANALNASIIPAKATREHKRTVATNVNNQGVAAVDSQGKKINGTGGAGVKAGDSVVMLVQRGAPDGPVQVLAKSQGINQRLERFGSQLKDTFVVSRLEKLKEQRLDAAERQLQQTLERASGNDKSLVNLALDQARIDRDAQRKRVAGALVLDQAALDCILATLKRVPASRADLTSEEQSRLDAACFASKVRIVATTPGGVVSTATTHEVPRETMTVDPTSGDPGTQIPISGLGFKTMETVRRIILVDVEVGEPGEQVEIERVVNGESQGTASHPGGIMGLEFLVPVDETLLNIQVIATDHKGYTTTDSVTVSVPLDLPPSVEIISPAVGAEVYAGEDITIEVQSDDDSEVVSVQGVLIGGNQRYHLEFVRLADMDWRTKPLPVPVDQVSLTIEVTATDILGQTGSASVVLTIITPQPTVRITMPSLGTQVQEGAEVSVSAQVSGSVSSVFFTFDSLSKPPSTEGPYTDRYTVPVASTGQTAASSVPPHVFVGKASLNGGTAPDGTLVTAHVEVVRANPLVVEATATGPGGQTATDSVTLDVIQSLPAGEATVNDGVYTLKVVQPRGQSFAGRTIRFRIGGQDVSQSAVWVQGDAVELDLTASIP